VNMSLICLRASTNPTWSCCCCVGLEAGSRLPSNLQLDPGTSYNAALAATMQKLPSSLTQALNAWDDNDKLQVRHDFRGRVGLGTTTKVQ
jgi:hypothetical protein